MTFDSTVFLFFFAAFFCLYHLLAKNYRSQNILIVIASCVFYGWWSWKLLFLMLFSVTMNYIFAILVDSGKSLAQRKLLLTLAICVDLAILGVFKYAGFFSQNLALLLDSIGLRNTITTLKIILPIGISFYTFQGMSYVIDVYRGTIKAEKDPVAVFAFKIYFAQLVAGPIERAQNLIPQFKRPRFIDKEIIKQSVWLIVWGYFLKVVISDPVSHMVDICFTEQASHGWGTILGTLAFTLQIYCDFLAYSIIAKGVSGLIGIELMWNFNLPYAAVNIQDFWRRWHISLSAWLRDYLYISLGGNRRGSSRTYINLLLTMLIGGLWHGAAWNFIIWGGWHGSALAIHRYFTRNKELNITGFAPLKWLFTFLIVAAGWFIFRCRSMQMAYAMLSAFSNMTWLPVHTTMALSLAALCAPVIFIETAQALKKDKSNFPFRSAFSYCLITAFLLAMVIIMFGRFRYAFIYFQF